MTTVKYDKSTRLPFQIPGPVITFVESYFEFIPPTDQADVFVCLFHPEPVPHWRSYENSTRLIDLHSDLDQLFANLPKGTRYEINRASTRDGVEAALLSPPTDMELDEFMNYYDEFAVSKGVPKIHRAQLRARQAAKKVALSVVRSAEGATLAYHTYLLGNARARLSHSASLFRRERDPAERAQIGRANRLLHWADMAGFQKMGVGWYDFGGWYEGSSDEPLLKINAFKKEFGGEVVREWHAFHSGSWLGSLYLSFRDLMLRRKT